MLSLQRQLEHGVAAEASSTLKAPYKPSNPAATPRSMCTLTWTSGTLHCTHCAAQLASLPASHLTRTRLPFLQPPVAAHLLPAGRTTSAPSGNPPHCPPRHPASRCLWAHRRCRRKPCEESCRGSAGEQGNGERQLVTGCIVQPTWWSTDRSTTGEQQPSAWSVRS